ncbi:MAG: formate dehydrogenase accessory sulfurtransferase FdhD [Chitinophagaceae bacterium]|nr:formate dehydrogenase accessory sulfurtransferase FdhD [Chitinophagaceae bacterium]
MSQNAVTKQDIRRVKAGIITDTEDLLATEEPLEIRLVYGPLHTKKNLAVTMRTPGNDEELAIGFLYTEGIISKAEDIASCTQLNDNVVQVTLAAGCTPDLNSTERNFYTTSSCGVCGKASIDAIKTECAIYDKAPPFTIPASLIYTLPSILREQQSMFRETGGIHGAALFDLSGRVMLVREDVGRHNAMDKLVGAALRSDLIPLQQHILLLSGRASFELVQKATMAGLKVIVSVGAPSSLAVQTADEFGITLAGFAKEDRFNIYCGSERITT